MDNHFWLYRFLYRHVRVLLSGLLLLVHFHLCSVVSAVETPLLVVPGVRLGPVALGATPAQVRKQRGKPSRTIRLGQNLLAEVWVTRTKTPTGVVEDEFEVVYLHGRAVQIEATSPRFRTRAGTGSASPMASVGRALEPLIHSVCTDPENYVLHYFDSVKTGLAFEWSGTKSGNVYRSDKPDSVIIHRRGVPVIPNKGSEWISSTSVLTLKE